MFEEIAYERANKKYPIPLVSSEVEIVSNYKYGEGFKDGMEFVYTKAKGIIENLIETLITVDGNQVEELKVVKEAKQFLKEEF
jgi:hypothetical protein